MKTQHDTVTLLTRANCPLCDDAKTVITAVQNDIPFTFEEKDVDDDPGLADAYGSLVPVILLNGVELSYGRVSRHRLEQHLTRGGRGAPPRLSDRYKKHLRRLRALLSRSEKTHGKND